MADSKGGVRRTVDMAPRLARAWVARLFRAVAATELR
jgi:hypothetical protein